MRRAIELVTTAATLVAACKGDNAARVERTTADDARATTGAAGEASPRTGPALTGPTTLTIPVADAGTLPPRARFLVITAAELRLLPEDARPTIDASGAFAIPDSTSIELGALGRSVPDDASLVLVADAKARAGVVMQVIGALGLRCWALGVGTGGQLRALTTQPCPPTAVTGPGIVELAIWLGDDGDFLGISRVNEITQFTDAAALAPYLRDYKAGPFFADRTDLAIAVDDDVTVGELAAAVGAALRAGFTSPRWVPPKALPVRIKDGVGPATATPPAVDVSRDGGGSGETGVGTRPTDPLGGPKVRFGALTGDFSAGGLTAGDAARVIKARAGILRACYQKELARSPGLAGDLAVTITIAPDGVVASVATGGSLSGGEVGACAKRQFLRMKFPAKGGATIAVPLAFAAT